MIPATYWSPTKKLMVLGAMAGGKLVEDTATGNPLTFITDKAKPLKSLLIPFTPKQDGTGDPSPSNIRSILPWNGLSVFGGGKNLLNENGTIYNRTIGSENWITSSTAKTLAFKGRPNTQYDISIFNDESSVFRMCTIDKDPSEVTEDRYPITNYKSPIRASGHASITTGEENIWIIVQASGEYITDRNAELMIVVGSEKPSAYEPYHPITETDIVFPSAVYGGTLDVVSGVLTVEWVKQLVDETFTTWTFQGDISDSYNRVRTKANAFADAKAAVNKPIMDYVLGSTIALPWHAYLATNKGMYLHLPKDITSLEAWETYLAEHPLTVVYELDEPYEIQLTPTQLTAILGNNTIWSDADGSMTAVYLKKG